MRRFLIGRLGALGDIVHAIPVAAALRRAYSTARIDWLVSGRHREILDLVPVIDRRLVINDRGDGSGGTSLLTAVRELRDWAVHGFSPNGESLRAAAAAFSRHPGGGSRSPGAALQAHGIDRPTQVERNQENGS